MTIAIVPLTDDQAARLERVMDTHADRGRLHRCALCHVPECPVWRGARADLAMAGRLDWDPIRDLLRAADPLADSKPLRMTVTAAQLRERAGRRRRRGLWWARLV